jgi:hypothetical protein
MGPYDLLRTVVEVFERLEIPYLVTGSVAAMAYGEPRLTNDIDVVASIQTRQIDDLLASFPAPDYYISKEMIQKAIQRSGQFNIIHPSSGLKIDVVLRKNTPHDQSRFTRRRRIHPAEDYEAYFAAPEDVILKKMEFYKAGGSEKHLRDITGIMRISGDEVDQAYIGKWAERLGVMEVWEAILKRLGE